MKIAHYTDIHLDHIEPHDKLTEAQSAAKFYRLEEEMNNCGADCIVMTGDESTAPHLDEHFSFLAKVKLPIYFVLGNHSFYFSSQDRVRYEIKELCKKYNNLRYLTAERVVQLTDKVALVGHDGWYDGRYAKWSSKQLWMCDYDLIEDLALVKHTPMLLLEKCREWADKSAEDIKSKLNEAFKTYEHIVVATHVPPFKEASLYRGKVSDERWLPTFSNAAMGQVLGEAAADNPDKKITILCGHSHGHGDAQILPNLRVITGEARYGYPTISGVLEV